VSKITQIIVGWARESVPNMQFKRATAYEWKISELL